MPRKKKWPPFTGQVLYMMSYLVFDDPKTNPCTTLINNMRNLGMDKDKLKALRKDLRRFRGIGQAMQYFAKKLNNKCPRLEKLKDRERRKAAFMACLKSYYDSEGKLHDHLSDEDKSALGVLAWRMFGLSVFPKSLRITGRV